VEVAGPRSRVQEVESAFTEAVSVDAARETVQQAVNVGLEDPLLRLDGGSRVRVVATIRQAHETRVFEALPVVARGRPARLDPSRVTVVVSGPAPGLGALRPEELSVFVNVPAQGPVPARLPLAVELPASPAGLQFVEARPAEVAVQVLRPARSTP
jgi:hypothetical protein